MVLGHHQKKTTKCKPEVTKKGREKGRFGMNVPLNAKGTTSDWKNIKDCVRETGALYHCPERWNVDDLFNDWLPSRKIS